MQNFRQKCLLHSFRSVKRVKKALPCLQLRKRMLFTGAACLSAACVGNIRIAVGTWLLSSGLSVYRRPNCQPQGLTCMVVLRQLSLWIPQSQFLPGLWKCFSNRHQDTGSDTMSSPPLKGPTWDLGTCDGWKYPPLIQASALVSGPQPTLSWPSCLTLYFLTLLYISSEHISLLTFHIYSHIVNLSHWTPVSPWG